ncbi:cell wall metabolism sensor histidine kinase WalK [Fundicoccus culcitae]|uniref:histidine kinase n=1 Tax=Fundicoccus culcitae TaxID=2969821 RepID=A0ABY5P3R1_9LACT|nr:cell wall metabolism sensor histidine kinase WalK [Fundicoccus culcitae]UUX33235.1 cell wall metabolism sensor histidine kinase WalK [Fundicoccus culcitae]
MKRPFSIFQSIYIKIPLLFIFILLIAFQFIAVFFVDQLETQTANNYKENMNTQVDLLVNNMRPILSEADLSNDERYSRMNQVLDSFQQSNAVYQVINPQSYVIATNETNVANAIGRRVNNNEINQVFLNQRSYVAEVYNPISGIQQYTVIQPIISQESNQLLGVIHAVADMTQIYEQTGDVMGVFIQSAVFSILLTFIVSIVLSQGLTRPIENIRQQAIRISEGNYDYPATVYGQDELGELAMTINDVAIKVKEAQELTESERQRLDGVLRHMTDGVLATDRRGNIILVNNRALSLLNVSHQKAIGMSILSLLDITDQVSLETLLSNDQEVLMNRHDGKIQTILKAEFSLIRRDTGFVTGLVCVLTDVTEQEKTEQERRDFVSNVSHELRTPLTSIKSYSEALSDGAWEDPDIAPQFIDVIQSETNRMIRMIGNLLDLSKLDGGQIKPEMELLDYKRVMTHILDRFEFMLKSGKSTKGFVIKREFTTSDIYIEMDQDRMTQVIDNIINNAIKYSPDGGEIFVSIQESHDKVTTIVRDQGLGIPQKDLPHLFERFYRVDKARSRDQGGTGLGLAISKEVIELHGGKIWAESRENSGSSFIFELPYENFEIIDEGWDD